VRHHDGVEAPVQAPAPPVVGDAGWRARVRRTPGGRLLLRVAVFLAGLFFVVLGLVLIVLPGPLTIPPILLGVWLWSTEFAWAHRLLERARRSAQAAWQQARLRPVWSAVVTGGGIVAFGVGLYLVGRYDLLDRARETVGL
jgi:uncharacterized membrane protein YbaN (DUF454 family)